MFGRKNENYDEYNEKYNARYDDDYIREEKEYRTECSHDHGQTYEDHNSEQQSYDQYNKLEEAFAAELEPGERILWCGRTEKDAAPAETGIGCLRSFCVGMTAFAIFLSIFAIIMGGIIIFTMIYLLKGTDVKKRAYAITDKRFMTLNKGKLSSIPLSSIVSVTYRSSPRNIGYVMFSTRAAENSQGAKLNMNNGIFGVKDPTRVCGILEEAKSRSKKF